MKEPPDTLIKIILVAISIAIFAFIGWACFKGYGYQPTTEKAPESQIERNYVIINGNSLKAYPSLYHYSPQVLGIMGIGLEYEEAELLNKIIECESGWRNVCNQRFGCNGGQGIAQIIPKTVRHCEKALGKPIDPFEEEDALECAAYLLTGTTAGKYHWGTPSSNWGSYWCWAN